jgi:predicted DsbA family dithiol-disulfide isomerase
VFLGAWYVLGAPPRPWGHYWYLVPLLTTGCGLMASVAMICVMVFLLKAWCFWCLIAHAVNGLLVIGTWWLRPRWDALSRERSRIAALHDARTFARATFPAAAAARTVALAGLLVAGLWVYRGVKLDTREQVARLLPYKKFVETRLREPAFLVREFLSQPQRALPEAGVDGVPTLAIFSDFESPHCACFAGKWPTEYRPRWSGDIKVQFRHLPLDAACNPMAQSGEHPNSCEASYAAEAARLQGGESAFWRMHDELFRRRRRLGPDLYATLAADIGLDGERLIEDMDDAAVKEAVARDVALAEKLGVRSTPSLLLNGRAVPDFCTYNPIFWEAISGELQVGSATVKSSHLPDTAHDDGDAS